MVLPTLSTAQIVILAVAGMVGVLLLAPLTPGIGARITAFFTKAKAGDLAGAVADAINSSPIIQKAQQLGVTGKNIVSYTDLKVASAIVPTLVDQDKQAETKAAFATILTNVATANVGTAVAPVSPAAI